MSLIDHQKERQALTELKRLQTHQSQARTLQLQGSQAIRLAVVEGYLVVHLDDPFPSGATNGAFVDIEAPDAATIMVGSLVHSMYLVSYNPSFPAFPVEVAPLDTSNAGWGGIVFNTWLPNSIGVDDPDYQEAYYEFDPADNIVPANRIRIGAKLTFQQGVWNTDTHDLLVMYQLRMTIGWN